MKYKLEIKWGIIFFLVTILWKLFEKTMGWHGTGIVHHATYSIIYDFLFILVFVLAFRNKRRTESSRMFSWQMGFRFGAILTLIVTALSPLVQTLTHRFISPEFFPNIIDLAVSHNVLTPEAAQEKFNLGNYIKENLFGTFAFGIILSLILPIFFRRKT